MRLGLYPLVISENKTQRFLLESNWISRLSKEKEVTSVTVRSSLDFMEGSDVDFIWTENGLSFEFTPCCTGEHTVHLYRGEDVWPGNDFMDFRFYVAPEKFRGLTPYKGDLHFHSVYSDGSEAPEFMAAQSREKGMDFAALTDHHNYEASLLAIEAAEKVNMDILMLKGEEISPGYGLGHVVSIGADRFLTPELVDSQENHGPGLQGWVKNTEVRTRKMWKKYQGRVGDIPPGVDERMYTYICGVIKEIQAAGGFAIFAHPYWPSSGAMDIYRKTANALMKEAPFDALELIGDAGYEEGIAFINRYLKDFDSPYVGSSDAHTKETASERYTIIFTEDLTEKAIREAISCKRSIAVTTERGSLILIAEDPELQEYGYFLEKHFFPKAEIIKKGQGITYKTLLCGYTGDDAPLRKQLREYYGRCFNW
jgi:predicted metal-dependent phosphoesterase TrpH